MGLIFSQMGSHFAQNSIPAPVLYSAVTNLFQGYVLTHNTPKPTPKQTFSWPELESGQNELLSVQFGPQVGQCLKTMKSGQNFSRCEQKNYSSCSGISTRRIGCLVINLLMHFLILILQVVVTVDVA